jgi:hypothetical protein
MSCSRVTALLAIATLVTTLCTCAAEEKENKLPADAKVILEKAEQFEMYSLDPSIEKVEGKEGFHGWKVLGKTAVKKAEVRKQLLADLDKGIADSDGNGAKCFDPRHGIRAKHDGKIVDLVICFECGWIYVFRDDKAERQGVAVTTGKPQASFDKVLKDAEVPLPKPAGK